MQLVQDMIQTGTWLFRWRSYLPLLMLVPLVLRLRTYTWPSGRYDLQLGWECVCLSVSSLGLLIRTYTLGHVPAYTSGRNSNRQRAHSLNTTGMYSLVRHPLYLGNFLIWLGIAMLLREWDLMVIFVLAFWLYYERIIAAEEDFLSHRFGEMYLAWSARTPAFVPCTANWQPPELPFCFLTVVRREFTSVFGICLGYFLLDLAINSHVAGRMLWQPLGICLAVSGTLLYVPCLLLKRRTQILQVAGR